MIKMYAIGAPEQPATQWTEASLENARRQMLPGDVITDRVVMSDDGMPQPQIMPTHDEIGE